jgi:hypothetical protein
MHKCVHVCMYANVRNCARILQCRAMQSNAEHSEWPDLGSAVARDRPAAASWTAAPDGGRCGERSGVEWSGVVGIAAGIPSSPVYLCVCVYGFWCACVCVSVSASVRVYKSMDAYVHAFTKHVCESVYTLVW